MTVGTFMASAKQRNTHFWLICETCGVCAPPPEPPDLPDFVESPGEPMKCGECGDLLLLVEAFIADETTMWHERDGATWKHVAYLDRLPTVTHRQRWVK